MTRLTPEQRAQALGVMKTWVATNARAIEATEAMFASTPTLRMSGAHAMMRPLWAVYVLLVDTIQRLDTIDPSTPRPAPTAPAKPVDP